MENAVFHGNSMDVTLNPTESPWKISHVFSYGISWEYKIETAVLLDRRISKHYKNSSGDEIANVNFLRRYGTYVLQNTKK